MADLSLLLDAQPLYSDNALRWSDRAAMILPGLAGIAAIAAGLEGLPNGHPTIAAWCGVAGGIASTLSIWATNFSSRARDQRLAYARSVADLGLEIADSTTSQDTRHLT